MVAKVIIDYSVLCYAMEDALLPLMTTPAYLSLRTADQALFLNDVVAAQLEHVASLMFMGDDRPSEYQLIFVTDTKKDGKYWRHEYLECADVLDARLERIVKDYNYRVEEHFNKKKTDPTYKGRKPSLRRPKREIAYKGGRKEVSHFQSLLRVVVREYVLKRGWSLLGVKGYEADDIAATLVKLNKGKEPMYLLTIDTDWLGLVSPNVTWFCTKGYAPRVRGDLRTVNVWAEHRLKETFNHPTELWSYKALKGDASDNLPIYSPIEVIDLLAPPAEYRLWDNVTVKGAFSAVLDENYNDASHGIASGQYLAEMRKLGIRPVIVNTQ